MLNDPMAHFEVDPECVAAVERTGRLLEDLGHSVEESHPQALDRLFERIFPSLTVVGSVWRAAQRQWLAKCVGRTLTVHDLAARLWKEAECGLSYSALEFAEASWTIAAETRPIPDWWDGGYDLLITPTLRQPAWSLGQNGGAADSGVFPFPFSLTGQPALSLPLHWTHQGLPVGVQVVAAYGREDVLLRVGAQLEEADSRVDRWPPIAAAVSEA